MTMRRAGFRSPSDTYSKRSGEKSRVATIVSAIPNELRELPNWVAWRIEIRNGKATKVPINPHTGERAASDNPATWGRFYAALNAIERYPDIEGVGFMFEGTPYAGVDLDKCRDPESGVIEPWAEAIIDRSNSYAEISPSGTGAHVLVKARLPAGRRRTERFEIYDSGRYFTMTGQHLAGTPETVEERQDAIEALHRETFPASHPTNGARPPQPVAATDEDLIEKARTARNGAKFERLWQGDWGDYPSESEADIALAEMLAFWTGADAERIDRLFRISGLYREKWDEPRGRDTYGALTVRRAMGWTGETYSQNGRQERTGHEDADSEPEPFPSRGLDEVLDASDLPLDVVISDGGEGAILTTESSGCVAGPTGAGKTNIQLRMSRSLCEGSDFLGLDVPRPRRVLYLMLEGSPRAIRRRLIKVFDGADAEARARFRIAYPTLNLADAEDLGRLYALIERDRPEVLIIDPLREAHPWDENDSAVMKKLTTILTAIIVRFGCGIVLAHHDRKRPPFVRRDGGTDRLRGSTAFTGWLSFALTIDRDGEDQLIAEWVKTRDAEATLERIALDFHRETLDFVISERAPEGKVSDDAILTAIWQQGGTVRGAEFIRGFVEGAGVGERSVREALRRLVKADKVREFVDDSDRQSRAKSYQLPSEEAQEEEAWKD
jgi:putative DNA primase/helicase